MRTGKTTWLCIAERRKTKEWKVVKKLTRGKSSFRSFFIPFVWTGKSVERVGKGAGKD